MTVSFAVILLTLSILRPLSAQTGTQSSPGQGPFSSVSAPSSASSGQTNVPSVLIESLRNGGTPLDVVFVIDENGKCIPAMPGVTWTQIDDLLKLMYQQNLEPLYSIQSFSAEGHVVENMANLTIHMRIHSQNEPVIRIPVGMKSGIFSTVPQNDLEQAIQYEGPSLFAIMAAPQGEGYDIILRSPKKTAQTPDFPPVVSEELSASESSPDDLPSTAIEEERPVSPETQNIPEADHEIPIVTDESESQSLVHHVTLRMSFPVTKSASNEYHLKAEFPPALSSQLQLEVPLPDAIVIYVQAGGLRQTVPFSETSTLFRFQGMRGDFELQWHEKQYTKIQEQVILQVENAEITAKLTSGGLLFDATIPVMASGGTFDSFQLQLPPGAVYRNSHQLEGLEYQVQVLTSDRDVETDTDQEAPPNPLAPQILQFQLAQPTDRPFHIRVEAETPVAHSQNGWFEVCGFDIPGAKKQFGKISVVVPPETRLRQQKNSHGVRPSHVTTMPEVEGIVSSFEYYEHPSSLLVQAVPQATRVYLRPEYQVQINRHHAVLIAKLSYTIHGGQNELNINMNGWQVTDIRPENLVNRDELPFMEDGPISISLLEPVGKKVDLNLRATRSFDSEDGEICFSFPVPEADFVEPAIVSIVPADNIELKTGSETPILEMIRKSRRTTPLDIELPPRQQEAMIYQLDHPVKAEFRAKLIQQKQKIAVQSQTEVSLHTNERVMQTLQYTVEYEPISRLVFAVPADWNDQNDLRCMFESRLLPLADAPGPHEEALTSKGLIFKQVQLPDDKIGAFQLTLSFLPDPQIVKGIDGLYPTTTVQVAVPVVVPVLPNEQSTILETVHVRYPRGLRVLHDKDSTWLEQKPTGMIRQTTLSGSVYQSEEAASRLSLGVSFQNIESLGSTTVEKGWVRTWLQGNSRFDYAVYQLTSNMSHLDVRFPEHVREEQLSVRVDGKSVSVDWHQDALRIPLTLPQESTTTGNASSTPASSGTRTSGMWIDILDSEYSHLVEFRYNVSMTTSVNHLELEMPQFSQNAVVRPIYYQLILPASRHLLSCDQSWMPQYRWQWSSGFKRKSILTQGELEDWIGMDHGEPVSPAMNSYLFLSFQPHRNFEMDMADRSTLILVSSGLILLFGLILLYFPRIRYPGVLFTLLVLFVSAFIYRVSLTIVFLQAGTIGFVLVLIALFLYRVFVSADPWRSPLANPLSTVSSGYSKVVHKVILPEEGSSDMARVKVSPPIISNDSDSSDSVEATQIHSRPWSDHPLPASDDRDENRDEDKNGDNGKDESHESTSEPGAR